MQNTHQFGTILLCDNEQYDSIESIQTRVLMNLAFNDSDYIHVYILQIMNVVNVLQQNTLFTVCA